MMEYLDERFPHPPLLPVYPVTRAQARLWMYRIERDWSPLVDTLMAHPGDSLEAKELGDALVGIAPIFAEMPYFLSEEFTLVDCCLTPILWRLNAMGVELPKNRQSKPLFEYMDRMFDRDSFRESLSEQEREIIPPV